MIFLLVTGILGGGSHLTQNIHWFQWRTRAASLKSKAWALSRHPPWIPGCFVGVGGVGVVEGGRDAGSGILRWFVEHVNLDTSYQKLLEIQGIDRSQVSWISIVYFTATVRFGRNLRVDGFGRHFIIDLEMSLFDTLATSLSMSMFQDIGNSSCVCSILQIYSTWYSTQKYYGPWRCMLVVVVLSIWEFWTNRSLNERHSMKTTE